MEIDGHDETTGEEIDWDCDTKQECSCGHRQRYKGSLSQYTCSNCSLKVKVMKGGKNGNNKNKEY